MKGAAEGFSRTHPQTAAIYDIAHKGACLLKHRFERDPRWSAFVQRMRQAKAQVQQMLPALLRSWSEQQILEALNRVPWRLVRSWCGEVLGMTTQAQRRLAYAPGGRKQNQDEPN